MGSKQGALTAKRGGGRHGALGLTEKDLLEMYEKMLLARALDERMWLLNRQGKANFVVSGQGHEAAQVGSAYALKRGVDFVLTYYRDHAVVLTLGMSARDVMLSTLAKANDPSSAGRQFPAHYSFPPLRIVSVSSAVATQIPHAVGIALASKLKGEEAVTIVYFGDGATSKGDFHEGLNFAGVHKLPVIFFCENNRYAISVPLSKQMAIEDVAERAKGYGFPGVVVDGNDVLAVYEVTKEAVDRARGGGGPTLIEAKTYRFLPHTSEDDDRRYRSREEVEEWRRRDPIERFRQDLLQTGILTETLDQETRTRVAAEADDAVEFAEKSPEPDPREALRHVYFEG